MTSKYMNLPLFKLKTFFHSINCISLDHGHLTDHGPKICNFCYEKICLILEKSLIHILRCHLNNIIIVLKNFLL